jgi:hypothetical protein
MLDAVIDDRFDNRKIRSERLRPRRIIGLAGGPGACAGSPRPGVRR